ncbi:hypothetical protein HY345_03010 [Candidatus Microgenomates bacterium]|nr:hypothetical protein [Candidatus Microgenomates bacterium]
MSYSRRLKNNFFSHSVPIMLGIFLSTFALVLTIPVTMIGLSQQQDLYSSAQGYDFDNISVKLNDRNGFFRFDDDRCMMCPPNWRMGMPCVAVDSLLCRRLSLTPTTTPQGGGNNGGKINDNDSKIQYTGSWNYESGGGGTTVAYKGDYHNSPADPAKVTTTTPQGTAILNFRGKKIGVTLLTWINRGIADIYVDGQKVSSLDGYYGQIVPKSWTSSELSCTSVSNGNHVIEVKHTGKTTAPRGGTYVVLDYFTVTPCDNNQTPTPTTSVSPVPGGESTLQLVPASSQIAAQGEFFATVQITTGNNQVTAVEGRVNFNSEYFSVLDVTPLGNFTVKMTNPEINNDNGFVKFIYGVTPGSSVKGSNLNVAVVKFKAKNKTGQQTISFGPNNTRVSALGYPASVLKGTSNMTVNVTGTPNNLLGDLNKDGKVDILDVNLVISNFGIGSCGNTADANSDCKVDIFDYNIVLQNFGKTS